MKDLGQFFRNAIQTDEQNQEILEYSPDTLEIASAAFEAFNTSNPLHGSVFPLSVKAMREFGAMLANLVGSDFGIVNSGGREALRIGMRAMKKRATSKRLVLSVDDPQGFVENVAQTLNLHVRQISSPELLLQEIPNETAFIVMTLDAKNTHLVQPIAERAQSMGLELHVHFPNRAFRKLLVDGHRTLLTEIFQFSPSLVSVSFDTVGLIYNGVSATAFADAQKKRDALEAQVGWVGGLYPGLNSAGSISGVEIIIAKYLVEVIGLEGLVRLAQNLPESPFADQFTEEQALQDRVERIAKPLSRKIVEAFHTNAPLVLSELLKADRQRNQLSPNQWRNELEQLLVNLSLSLFGVDSENFKGLITSGGTESIRVAMQTYIDRTKNRFGLKPIFLMAPTAHIAFFRHLQDNDAEIILVKVGPDKRMDLEDLELKLKRFGPRISAIIASTPNYPFGAVDPIEQISELARLYEVPLHVDSCLGGFVLQFVENNPYQLDLRLPKWRGVTSWSADIHKYGITHKGLSFVGFRRLILQNTKSQHICARRSSSSIQVGLECMLKIGKKGYEERAQKIAELGRNLTNQLKAVPEIEVVGEAVDPNIPDWVVAFRMRDLKYTYTIASYMKKLGWHLSQVGDYTVHFALTNAQTYDKDFLVRFMDDLKFCVSLPKKYPGMQPLGSTTSGGIYGMMSALPNFTAGKKTTAAWLEEMLGLHAENTIR